MEQAGEKLSLTVTAIEDISLSYPVVVQAPHYDIYCSVYNAGLLHSFPQVLASVRNDGSILNNHTNGTLQY